MKQNKVKSKRQEDLCAVFVHAGAGYHSKENERKHLEVCELWAASPTNAKDQR